MKLLLLILAPLFSLAAFAGEPQELGTMKDEDSAIYRLPGGMHYYIDRVNQTCFMVQAKVTEYGDTKCSFGSSGCSPIERYWLSEHYFSTALGGVTTVDCAGLKVPEIQKFLASGRDI